MTRKAGTYEAYLLPEYDFDEPMGPGFSFTTYTVQLLYRDPKTKKELPILWSRIRHLREGDERQIMEYLAEDVARYEFDEHKINLHFIPAQWPPKTAYFPGHLNFWHGKPLKSAAEPRFNMTVFIPLEPGATTSYLSPEEGQQSLEETGWDEIEFALHASVDFEIMFGWRAEGAGTGYGYRELNFDRLTEAEVNVMRPLAEDVLTKLGYSLGRGRMRARVEVSGSQA